MDTGDLVVVDIGGTIFKFPKDCLLQHRGTKLTETLFLKMKPDGNSKEPYIFFKVTVSDFHTAELHLPTNLCGFEIRKELVFWGISESVISPCCWRPLYQAEQDQDVEKNLTDALTENTSAIEDLSPLKQFQLKVWTFLDKPKSSYGAKLWNTIFMSTITISAMVVILESVPAWRQRRHDIEGTYNATYRRALTISPKMVTLIFTTPHPVLTSLDMLCLSIFSLEFLIRLAFCPARRTFFKQPANWIDLIAAFSGLCIICTEMGFTHKVFPESFEGVYIYFILRCTYTLRLFKLFRLSERSLGLKVMLLSVWCSKKELLLLIFAFVNLAAIMGSVQYYCEIGNTSFDSIPTSIWWAIVTMTTVGYGDYFPKSPLGYMVGTLCALVGVLLLSMPVAVIAANFNDFYTRSKCESERRSRVKSNQARQSKVEPIKLCF